MGILPNADARTSLRVACRLAMFSTIKLLGNVPGDWISRRSENINRRILTDFEASGLDLDGRLERLITDLDDDLFQRIHLGP